MTSAEDAIALLRSRVDHHRIGRSTWREMDEDILAMRKAIELLEQSEITTLEELDALPVGSIVRHHSDETRVMLDGSWEKGAVAEKRIASGGGEAWFFVGRGLGYKSHQADLLPALLVYMGGPV